MGGTLRPSVTATHGAAAKLLKASLAEEQATDAKLSTLAQAMTIDEAVADEA